MTGSGKTGLGIVLIEECLAAGVPCLLIDPKGDLTNLLLLFPQLAPSDFRPWINEGDAQKAGVTPDQFAEQQATTWREGLAGWGIGTERLQAVDDGVRFTIYTPGSTAGVPVNLVGSLQAPADPSDIETMRDEIEGFVSGLLGLVGIAADPLASREFILLANLIETSWSQGRSLDLATLVGQVLQPPLRKLGVFDLDTFFPPADRQAFALRLNGLLASPAFAAWAEGTPLDIATLLRSPDGKPCAAIVSIAHLSEDERQFVTSLLLSKVVTWMRKQSGTTDLRALVYMDEVAGYVPPTANPPTKKPIMTLMKQARAFGVGVVLATQNPVDLDYKAISNAGTWMVGRLQTERDKARLLEGMSAAAGTVDVGAVSDTISGLAKREFVLKRAGKDVPEIFTTRWAMSYLRGPLTATRSPRSRPHDNHRLPRPPRRHRPCLHRPRPPRPPRRRLRQLRRLPPRRGRREAPTTVATAPAARCARCRRDTTAARGGRRRARALARPRGAVGAPGGRRGREHPLPGRRGRQGAPALRRREGRPRPRRGVGGGAVPAHRRHRPRGRPGRRLRRPRPHHPGTAGGHLRPAGRPPEEQDVLVGPAARHRRHAGPQPHHRHLRQQGAEALRPRRRGPGLPSSPDAAKRARTSPTPRRPSCATSTERRWRPSRPRWLRPTRRRRCRRPRSRPSRPTRPPACWATCSGRSSVAASAAVRSPAPRARRPSRPACRAPTSSW